jgi:hypothetical protein
MSEQLPAARKEYGNGPLKECGGCRFCGCRSLLAGAKYTKFDQAERVKKTLSRAALTSKFDLSVANATDFPNSSPGTTMPEARRYRAIWWRTDRTRAPMPSSLSAERELGSAFVLCDLLEKAKKTDSWRQFDALIQTFVGVTDSATFDDLRALMKKCNIATPADIKDFAALTKLQDEILKGKLGLQDIRGDVYIAFPSASERIPLPRSFTVLGQKFVMDSWVTSEVVFDSIEWQKERVIRRV